MKPTRRDSTNQLTVLAVCHLVVAQDARKRYHAQIRAAIECFGDVVDSHYISGIYGEHFPDYIKARLRSQCSFMNEQMDMAMSLWKRAGRRLDTLRPLIQHYSN